MLIITTTTLIITRFKQLENHSEYGLKVKNAINA